MTEEEARAKRLALWEEVQAGPTPERAAEIAKEATELLEYFDRNHPLHDRVTELILTAQRIAGREQVFRGW